MKNRDCSGFAVTICLAAAFSGTFPQVHAQTPSPAPIFKNVTTTLGTTYCIDEDFLSALETKIAKIRAAVRAERASGKFIGYISIPIAAAGGDWPTSIRK